MAGPGKVFSSLRALKSHLQSTHKRSLCDICLEGRKVFVAEQIAYTKPDLDRHMKHGDLEGEMAESGFKGHPECRFCKKRFYGENELYQHMHTTHEECFLCRRAAPHRHVYYRDYPDLENHFRQAHHQCEDPKCLEQKFVVFPTEQELKTHTAREHGHSLSKAERKQALTLPVSFNYRRGGESDGVPTSSSASNLAAVAASGQRTVVIGGAASVPSQFGQNRRGSRPNMAALEAQQHAAAMQDSRRTAQAQGQSSAGATDQQQQQERGQEQATAPPPDVSSLNLRESEFPSMVGPSSGPAIGGRWAGASGPSTSSGLRAQDFPALPGTSKSAKKRAGKKKTAAEIVGGGGSVRVLQAGGSASGSSLAQDNFPVLSATPFQREELDWQPVPRRWNLPRPPSSQEIAEPPPVQPTMPASVRKKKQPPPVPRPNSKNGSASSVVAPPPSSSARNGRGPIPGARAGDDSEGNVETALATGGSGISSALRAANKELISKIKTRLGDGDRFAEFKKQSAAWVKGALSSQAYHAAVSSMGLVSVVPELATTCPDAKKRDELLDVHAAAFTESAPSGKSGNWMPPEAAMAAAAHAAAHSSWSCGTCTLVNAPAAVTCEACGNPKPRTDDSNSQWKAGNTSAAEVIARNAMVDDVTAAPPPVAPKPSLPAPPSADAFPSLPLGTSTSKPSASSAGAGPSGSKKGGGKKGKQSLNEFMTNTKVDPQNIWRNPALKGQWASAGAGKLAGEERAVKDAWSKE